MTLANFSVSVMILVRVCGRNPFSQKWEVSKNGHQIKKMVTLEKKII